MTAAGGEVLTPRASKELTGQCFLVEGLRSEIQAVRPRDRPCLWVHTDSGEEGRIPQWLENPRQSFCRESDVAHRSTSNRSLNTCSPRTATPTTTGR